MPYVSLEQQGFYKPFEQLGQGLLYRQQLKRQKEQDAIASQQAEQQKLVMESQLKNADLTRQRLQSQMAPAQELRGPGGAPWGQVINGEFHVYPDVAKADPLDRFTLPKPFTVSNPMTGAPLGASALPPDALPSGYRLGWGKTGKRELLPPADTTEQESVTIETVPVPGGGSAPMQVRRKGGQIVGYSAVPDGGTEQGIKALDATTKSKLDQLNMVLNQFPGLVGEVEQMKTAGGPVAGPARWFGSKIWGPSMEQSTAKGWESKFLSPLARGVMSEVGVLDKNEQERYLQNVPLWNDTYDVRKRKLEGLQDLLGTARRNMIASTSIGNPSLQAALEKVITEPQWGTPDGAAPWKERMSITKPRPPVTAPPTAQAPAPTRIPGKTFQTEAELEAAAAHGLVLPGDRVIVAGRSGTYNP